MSSHIQIKFPEHRSLIQHLLQEDQVFAEVCANYEEICTWLAGRTSKEELAPEENGITRELIRDLEEEILDALKKATK